MLYKVAELVGELLDLAVAKCDPACIGLKFEMLDGAMVGFDSEDCEVCIFIHGEGFRRNIQLKIKYPHAQRYSPSTIWQQGGPIMESNGIEPSKDVFDKSVAMMFNSETDEEPLIMTTGATYLIAAMRTYVDSKFGDEIEL